MRIDELRSTLAERADTIDGIGLPERVASVNGRVAAAQRRRSAMRAVAVTVVAVAAVAGFAVLPGLMPTRQTEPPLPSEHVEPVAERLAGWQMPETVRVQGVTYGYFRGEESRPPHDLLRVAVAPDPLPQVLAWSSTDEAPGEVVVSVNGEVVSRSAAGALESGVLLEAEASHLVVVRFTAPQPGNRLGFAVYRRPY